MHKKSIKLKFEEPTIYVHKAIYGLPSNIKVLDLSGSTYVQFPDGVLSQYENIEIIALRNCNLKFIPEDIFYLQKVRKLFLGGNKLETIPSKLFNLNSLEEIQLSNNNLTEIPEEIYELRNLKILWLNRNKIKKIPPTFKNFQLLQKLYISHNLIENIPNDFLFVESLQGIYLNNNPLNSIPIYDFEGNSLEQLRVYYNSISNGSDKTYEAKIVFLGDGAVGKTTLINKLVNGRRVNMFGTSSLPKSLPIVKETKGVEVKEWRPLKISDGDRAYDLSIKIWDFGGQEIQSEVHHLFLSNETLYLLLWANRIVNNKNRYLKNWLNKIDSYGGKESKVVIVQTMFREKDTSYSTIDRETISRIYSPLIVDFVNISSLKEIGIYDEDGLMDRIIAHVLELPNVGKEISIAWIEIKNILNQIRKKQHILELEEFYKICLEKNINRNESKLLLSWLHNIGDILYYEKPKEVRRYLFLDPNWVTNIFYRIILDDKKIISNNKGVFSLEDVEEYISIKEEIIIDLMIKFHFCFKIDEDNDIYILPALLPFNNKEKNFSFLKEKKLSMQYEIKFKIIPISLMPRFISKCYKDNFVYLDYYWKDGVILKISDCFVKVDTLKQSKDINSEIFVEIYGNEKWFCFKTIRSIFQNLLSDKTEYKEFIGCFAGYNCKNKDNYFFDIEIINRASEAKIEYLQCGKCFKDIPVTQLLSKKTKEQFISSDSIRDLISQGKIEKSLDLLFNSSSELIDKNTLILLRGKYKKMKYEKTQGALSQENFEVKSAEISKSLLEIIPDKTD